MINIKLINRQKDIDGNICTTLDVNGKTVDFLNKVLTGVFRGDLTESEEKAAIWFANCELNVFSSIIK